MFLYTRLADPRNRGSAWRGNSLREVIHGFFNATPYIERVDIPARHHIMLRSLIIDGSSCDAILILHVHLAHHFCGLWL